MVTKAKPCDVFLSYAASDKVLATTLAEALRLNGLEPFTDEEAAAGQDMSDALWEALAESKALVAILSRPEPSPSMAVEIGAAQAWSKPIYAVVSDPATIRLPAFLSRVRVLPPDAIDEVIHDVQHAARSFTEADRAALREVYLERATPLDRFATDHQLLQRLGDQFHKRSGKRVAPERLLEELLRMRKRGALPRVAAKQS